MYISAAFTLYGTLNESDLDTIFSESESESKASGTMNCGDDAIIGFFTRQSVFVKALKKDLNGLNLYFQSKQLLKDSQFGNRPQKFSFGIFFFFINKFQL